MLKRDDCIICGSTMPRSKNYPVFEYLQSLAKRLTKKKENQMRRSIIELPEIVGDLEKRIAELEKFIRKPVATIKEQLKEVSVKQGIEELPVEELEATTITDELEVLRTSMQKAKKKNKSKK